MTIKEGTTVFSKDDGESGRILGVADGMKRLSYVVETAGGHEVWDAESFALAPDEADKPGEMGWDLYSRD